MTSWAPAAWGWVEGRRVLLVGVTCALHSFLPRVVPTPHEGKGGPAAGRLPQDTLPTGCAAPSPDPRAGPSSPPGPLSVPSCVLVGLVPVGLVPGRLHREQTATVRRVRDRLPAHSAAQVHVSVPAALPPGAPRTCGPRRPPCRVGEGNSGRRGVSLLRSEVCPEQHASRFRRWLHLPCSLSSWSASTGSHPAPTPTPGGGGLPCSFVGAEPGGHRRVRSLLPRL